MAPPKLSYFPIKGIGEPIRFILSYAGEDFIDERINAEDWPAVKRKMPFGKIPVIEINGKVVPQTRAIARYFAKKAGIAGKDEWEALLIDSTVDTLEDLRTAVAVLHHELDESSRSKKYDVLLKETVPFYMGRLEKQVKDNGGYFVNGKLSWAELYFVAILDNMNIFMKMNLVDNHTTVKALRDKVLALPAIKAWISKRPDSHY